MKQKLPHLLKTIVEKMKPRTKEEKEILIDAVLSITLFTYLASDLPRLVLKYLPLPVSIVFVLIIPFIMLFYLYGRLTYYVKKYKPEKKKRETEKNR